MLSDNDIAKKFFSVLRKEKTASIKRTFDVSDAALSNWRKAKNTIPIEKLALLAEIYNVSLDWLVLGREQITPDMEGYKKLYQINGTEQGEGYMRNVVLVAYSKE